VSHKETDKLDSRFVDRLANLVLEVIQLSLCFLTGLFIFLNFLDQYALVLLHSYLNFLLCWMFGGVSHLNKRDRVVNEELHAFILLDVFLNASLLLLALGGRLLEELFLMMINNVLEQRLFFL